ncbi:MAG: hypothetical protein KatS3mg095_0548 [Candidatus Parcubacteria bacterium]|nr:MAG: hypothetical protein KatS3mg095_0548 [Candidatus Parcubacteria bacterium]
MKKLIVLFLPLITFAVCPICITGVGIGLGLSRYLGIDDLITGFWLGALVIALFLWTVEWLDKKNIHFYFKKILIFLTYYILLFLPLYYNKIISQKLELLIKDRLLVGIIFGSLILYLSVLLDKLLRKKNNNKALFPFQKVVIPLSFLIFLSLVAYLIIK